MNIPTDQIVKILSLAIILFVSLGCVVIFVYDTLMSRSIPDVVSSFIFAAVGYAIHALGVDFGVIATNTTQQNTASIQNGNGNTNTKGTI